MSVTLIVLAVALLAAAIVMVWSRSTGPRQIDPIDTEAEQRWLVRVIGRHPALRRWALQADQHVVGGLALVVALLVLTAGAIGVGLLFDMVDRDRGLARWDRAVADWGSEHASSWSTEVLEHVTELGATPVVVAIAVVIALVDHRRQGNRHVPLFLAAVLGGVFLVNNALKLIVDRDRPDVVHLVSASSSSFPSGHSATAAAAWCAFALVATRHEGRRRRAVGAAVAAVVTGGVAASRALLGVHWLTDVLAGVTVGWTWFLLCALAFGGRLQRLGEPVEEVADEPRVMLSPGGE
jgi:membrane-associated phospholipid phosphatase